MADEIEKVADETKPKVSDKPKSAKKQSDEKTKPISGSYKDGRFIRSGK